MKCNRREFLKSLLAAGAYISIPKAARVLIEQEIESEIYSESAEGIPVEGLDIVAVPRTITLQVGDEVFEPQHIELRTRYDDMGIDGYTGYAVYHPPSKPEYCLYVETASSRGLDNVIATQKRCGSQDITVRVGSTVVLQATGEVCLRWFSGVCCFEMSLRDPEIGERKGVQNDC